MPISWFCCTSEYFTIYVHRRNTLALFSSVCCSLFWMSMSLEHDYIGLKSSSSSSLSDDFPSMDKNSDKNIRKVLNLKATELRLGLPGSESPEGENNKENPSQLSIGLNNKTFVVSGAKRGFSVASGNWVFYGNPGFDPTFSPRGADTGKTVNASDSNQVARDGLPHSPKPVLQDEKKTTQVAATANNGVAAAPASKAQVVGWPPIRSFRKNTMASHSAKADYGTDAKLGLECLYVKVSMDGAPYLRKVDLKTYGSYTELSSALEKMFSCFTIGQCGPHGVPSRDGLSESRLMDLLHGSEYVLTYEDKDGDWMLVGDVPWKMFADSCRKLRIMKSSEAIGLAPTAMEKCRSRN